MDECVMRLIEEHTVIGQRMRRDYFIRQLPGRARMLYLTGSENHPGLKTKKKQSIFTAELKHSDMRRDTKWMY